MAGIPLFVNQILLARFYCQQGSQVSINDVYYRCGAPTGVVPTTLDAANSLSTGAAPSYKAIMTATASYAGAGVQDVPSVLTPVVTPSVAEYSTNGAGVGTAGVTPLPAQTAGVLAALDGTALRGGRGRVYVPFPDQASNGPTGLPAASYITKLNSLGAALYGATTVTGAGGGTCVLTPVLYHRQFAKVKLVPPKVSDVAIILARQKWGTQRRRGSYGRLNSLPF